MFDLVMSIMVLAAIALALGAIAMFRRGQRKQAGLMVIMVLVIVVNLGIWLLPDADGNTLADAAARSGK